MVDCFNELLTQSNSAPTYRNRYFLPRLSQLLRQYPRGLVGATHRHLRTPRVTRMQTRVAIGGTTNAPAGHTDTCHICCNEMFSCNEIRPAGSNRVGSTMKRTRDFNRSATSPPTRAPVARLFDEFDQRYSHRLSAGDRPWYAKSGPLPSSHHARGPNSAAAHRNPDINQPRRHRRCSSTLRTWRGKTDRHPTPD